MLCLLHSFYETVSNHPHRYLYLSLLFTSCVELKIPKKMASKEEGEETASCTNEWEVVSLTKSAYAAAPGPKQIDLVDDSSAEYVAETADTMFMSGHFDFPIIQHEKLALQPDKNGTLNELGGENATPELIADKGGNSDKYEKSSSLSKSGAEFEENAAFQGLSVVDIEHDFFDANTYSSFHGNEPMGVSVLTEEGNMHAEPAEPSHEVLDSDISYIPMSKDEDNNNAENLPCQTWWRRQTVSLISHAKDANAFWSIFVAAAVMGLVVIGQRWRQDRWQVLQFGGREEIIARTSSPISRLKDVMLGGDRHSSLIRGSSSAQR